jgi:tetratricopeptide (TPR) repeat protein
VNSPAPLRAPLRLALALLACGTAALALASDAKADRVVTRDNRVLTVKRARQEGDRYLLRFEHGDVYVDAAEIKSAEIEGDMSEYVPQNDDEREKLAQGYVRYRGKWFSKGAYQMELDRQAAQSRERTSEAAKHSDFFNGWVKETRHFKLKTNTSPELLDYYADLLEEYYKLMDDRIGINPPAFLKRTKMQVNIYKSRGEFLELSEAGGGGVIGYFSPADQSLNFFHHYPEPALSTWVALHECTHLLTYLVDPFYQPNMWVNEGVADFFGSAVVAVDPKGKVAIQPGNIQQDRILTVQNAIKEKKDIKLERLFKVTRANFTAFEYAHAWSFVYFLNNTEPAFKSGFERFFKELYTGKGVEQVHIGYDARGGHYEVSPAEVRRLLLAKLKVKDTDELDQRWKSFIAGIVIDGPEARARRGQRYVATGDGDSKEALEDLDAAIEAGLTDVRNFTARAQIRASKGNKAGALADYAKAIEIDPLDAGTRFAHAALSTGAPFFLMNFGGFQISVDAEEFELDASLTKEQVDTALMNLGVATELAPEVEYYRACLEDFKVAMEARAAAK